MERRRSATIQGLVLGVLLALFGVVSCTVDPPPTDSATTSGTSGMAGRAPSSDSADPSPPASTPGTANQSSPASSGGTAPIEHANGVHVLVKVEAADLPPQSTCSGFFQNTGTVQSGGGGLGGAAIPVGEFAALHNSELTLLPGTYDIGMHCASGAEKWAGHSSGVKVIGAEKMDIVVTLTRSLR